MKHVFVADCYLLFPYSRSLLLLQQPVRRQDLYHHVRSHQHVLLSCHGTSCTELHLASQRTLHEAVDLFAFGILLHFNRITRRWHMHSAKHVKVTSFVASPGASDVGSCSSDVHPVRHRCVPGADNLHEESGCQPARQEEQEAAGLHLPHQE